MARPRMRTIRPRGPITRNLPSPKPTLRVRHGLASPAVMNNLMIPRTLSRYFTTLAAASSQYWTMGSALSLAGDFEVEFDAVLGNSGSGDTIIGRASSNSDRIKKNGTKWFIQIAGAGVTFSSNITADAKLRNYKFIRVGTTISYYENDVFIESITLAGTFTFDLLGVDNPGNYLNGVLANVKITDAGTPIHLWKLDSADPSTELDTIGSNDLTGTNLSSSDSEIFYKSGIDWLGVELVTNGDFDSDTGWTKGTGWTISGGQALYDGTGGTSSIGQAVGAVETYSYKTSLDVISNTGTGTNVIDIGATRYNNSHLNAGSHSFISIQAASGGYALFGRASEPFVVDNVSTKRLLEGV